MRILVTGARGKVGAATVHRLLRDGHQVTAVDVAPAVCERAREVRYVQADLSDAGHAAAVVPGHEAVVHCAAIPSPKHNPPHVIFQNNLMATYHLIEAAERSGARRVVHISSETVPGFSFPRRYFHADYAPIDEDHPVRPQDSYALSKWFGELLMDAAVQRGDLTGVSVRPTWVQWEGNIERNVGPIVRDGGTDRSASFWSYVLVYDLADLVALAATTDTPGHEVVYCAAADNAAGGNLHDLVRRNFDGEVDLRPVDHAEASGISCAKAARVFGWKPTRSWRDLLDADGRLLPEARQRVAEGRTGVQLGLRASS
ncbi:NAD-dependent epimerase/dehydratase family protein [Goodfellowiella coeruleoviolacea]|uniref:Nucleoside-diphosphate-sugar epimerase n=1 Tax=Goodfellowiella coeruleoviolacea TaxID=334858 RepID=A0AAE3G8H5_9PSEU|nr:NAD(P)-dependent oxidoreductase [Goodfellowiella coeruleoviolacea]MCP2163510.1 Nucleoside-diphosphate-sugar epimerase [Goodfellowiella coeruleoviolacea]